MPISDPCLECQGEMFPLTHLFGLLTVQPGKLKARGDSYLARALVCRGCGAMRFYSAQVVDPESQLGAQRPGSKN